MKFLNDVGRAHNVDYAAAPEACVFALSTYIAIVAKACAALALSSASSSRRARMNPAPSLNEVLQRMEDADWFRAFGIKNMLGIGFFAWYSADGDRKSVV